MDRSSTADYVKSRVLSSCQGPEVLVLCQTILEAIFAVTFKDWVIGFKIETRMIPRGTRGLGFVGQPNRNQCHFKTPGWYSKSLLRGGFKFQR